VNAELEGFLARDKLSDEELDRAFAIVMDGEAAPEQIMPFLLASIPLMNNPRALAAGARAMRERMIPVRAPAGAIDVCGTGGDGAHTLNVSTAASFVLAGAGVPVAKHGNRAMSSKSGAADVLEALGVKLTNDIPTLERALREANVTFLFAQNHHIAMRHVAAARRELGQRTIFNLLGPLSNPAGVKRQLVGVFGGDFVQPMAEALSLLGTERALMVHGAGGLDELSPAGESRIADIRAEGPIATRILRPVDFGLAEHPLEAIRGGDASVNAEALRRLLDGETGAYRDTVVLNAAAALIVAGKAENPRDAAEIAIASLDGGKAREALSKLVAITNS
jgi:anthranilate phosphoribosyltransferase